MALSTSLDQQEVVFSFCLWKDSGEAGSIELRLASIFTDEDLSKKSSMQFLTQWHWSLQKFTVTLKIFVCD